MAEFDRLSERIAWIDLSFVKRDRTPRWAIEVGIRCHLAGMSLREVSKHLERFGIDRSHVAIHDWVHKADLQPISTVSEDQLAVDEKMIRLHGQKFWLYGAVDPYTNHSCSVNTPSNISRALRSTESGVHEGIDRAQISQNCRIGLNRTPMVYERDPPREPLSNRK